MSESEPMPVSLSVSIVTYAPDLALLERTLQSLAGALARARSEGALGEASVCVIDNGPGEEWTAPLRGVLAKALAGERWIATDLAAGHGNVGYGAGHNLALLRSVADYHLVLNPDVIVRDDALATAVGFMQAHADIGLLAPGVAGPGGETQYLCKRYPSLLDLFLRGFTPAAIRRLFDRRLSRYEMRRETDTGEPFDAPVASGCFMLLRRPLAQAIGGFSDAFFLYFEDFDLSLRIAARARVLCLPQVRIVHYGGDAARKGLRHVWLFARSGVSFFSRHGWKLM